MFPLSSCNAHQLSTILFIATIGDSLSQGPVKESRPTVLPEPETWNEIKMKK
jgi:hypothetical protein